MRWIAHIVTVFAVVGCLVGAGQVRADYVTHADCKSEQATFAGEQADLDQLPERNEPGQADRDDLAKISHCSYCWANVTSAMAAPCGPAPASQPLLSQDRIKSLPLAALERPPKNLIV